MPKKKVGASTSGGDTQNGGRRGTRRRKSGAWSAKRSAREPVGKRGVPGSKNDSRRCTATAKHSGERCKRAAIKGGTVCTTHGGNLPQVRKKARERLQELVDPFITELRRIVLESDAEDAVKMRGIVALLDRTGYGPTTKLEVGTTKWDTLADEVFTQGGVDRSGVLNPPGKRALPTSGGGALLTEDAEQHGYDAQQDAWREYDNADAHEYERGRMRPDENTVTGIVVSKYDVPADRDPEDPPAYGADGP